MPTVLNGKRVIEGIDRRRLSHWITIDGLAGQQPGATLARTLPYAAAPYPNPSTSEFRESPGLRRLLPLASLIRYQRHHQFDSHLA